MRLFPDSQQLDHGVFEQAARFTSRFPITVRLAIQANKPEPITRVELTADGNVREIQAAE